MPATPAWPPRSLPRLFVRQALSEGSSIELDAGQANYLGNVMRLGVGAELLVFDGASGEWLARVAEAGRKRMTLAVERQTRTAQEQLEDALFTGLRLSAGVDCRRLGTCYGVDVWDRYGDALQPHIDAGRLVFSEDRLRLTRDGMLVANDVMTVFV